MLLCWSLATCALFDTLPWLALTWSMLGLGCGGPAAVCSASVLRRATDAAHQVPADAFGAQYLILTARMVL